MPSFEIPGMPGANIGMINIGEMLGKSIGSKPKKKKMTVKESLMKYLLMKSQINLLSKIKLLNLQKW